MNHQERTKLRVNVQMSDKIGTKTPHQCHSRHQKMLIKYGSLDNLLIAIEGTKNEKKRTL
jgi:predicted P-loop ATPase